MLSEAQVKQYRDLGYVRGGQVLDDAWIDELQSETLRVIADRDNGGRQPVWCKNIAASGMGEVWQIVNIWEASEAFRRLVFHPGIAQAVGLLSESRTVRLWHDQIQYKPAGTGGVNMWHQDSIYWPIISPKERQITAWIALDDADVDNGCMSMVPASHKWGDASSVLHALKEFGAMPPTWNGHPTPVVACPVPRGFIHFHHSMTWHGSPANASGRPRRAIALHFMTAETTFDPKGSHPMLQYVKVAKGEVVTGDKFPVVWDAGRVVGDAVRA